MKLYEITSDFRALFDGLEDLTENEDLTADQRANMEQAWFDTLESIEGEFVSKAENIAALVKQLQGEAKMLKKEEDAIAARRRQKERLAERLKNYLLDSMTAINLLKIDEPMAKISVRNNAESVAVDDEKSFIDWAQKEHDDLLRYKLPEINKTGVKKLLQAGEEIPHVRLVRTQSLIIK